MSVGKASAVVAAGTMVSRVTGLVRSVLLAATLGSIASDPANAFSIANQLPNNIFALLSSGLFAGILVPQIVRAAAHKDGGSAFVSKLITLGTVAVGAATVVAVVAAPLLVYIYGGRMSPDTIALTLAFAYWCLPQLFFLGLYSLLGEVLNARKVFGPYAWSPIANNIVSIAGFGLFLWLFGPTRAASGWTYEMVAVIGGTATGGIVVQALILLLFWRRAALKVRPDFRWRGMGLRHLGTLAGWSFAMIIVGQIAGAVQVNLVGAASDQGAAAAAMAFAWTIYILPYSVIVMSIMTPYYTRLSTAAAVDDVGAVRADLDSATRIIGVFVVGSLAAIIAAIMPISRIFTDNPDQTPQFALVLAAYLVALVPQAIHSPIWRTFYAYRDTFSPFLFALVQAVLVVVTALLAFWLLPVELLAFGIALGQSLANIVQLAVAASLLRRKIGPLGLRPALVAYVRFMVAFLPAAGIGLLTATAMGAFDGFAGWALQDWSTALVTTAVVGAVTLIVYVLALAVLRTPELRAATAQIRRLLTR